MKSALIVIDMQQGLFSPASPKHDAANLISRLNHLGQRIRAGAGVVVFVQHEGLPGDAFEPQSSGWQLLPDLVVQANDLKLGKKSCDAFLNTGLSDLLHEQGVERLVITGCATDYCVDTTVRSALARSWPTVVPADGHTTSNRPHLTAEKIIAHHNAIWADFIAPAGPATVSRCAEIS
jgi:nicotinamidase-related amidase